MKRETSKWKLLILCFALVGLASQNVLGAIPAKERAALIALYNATNGNAWDYNTNWKGVDEEADGFSKIGTEGTWFGVTVSNGHVTKVELDSNDLSGYLPSELGDLDYLEILDIRGEYNLGGSIPPELGNLTNLEQLNLTKLKIGGAIPSELGNLDNLKTLNLSDCSLGGSIPPELGNLSSLEYLNISRNSNINGVIPEELGNLANLEYLILMRTKLSGNLPAVLGNLSNLKTLNLEECYYIKGAIPSELGNLGNLVYLNLSDNSFTGSIPSSLGNLRNLKTLDLEYNGLTGSIPTSLTNLTNCSDIDIHYNSLYTDDEALIEYLEHRAYGWRSHQTSPPSDLAAAGLNSNTVRVYWEPIKLYDYYGSGGYMVYYGTSSGGPWTYAGQTTSRDTKYYDVTGLNLGTTYYFKVKTESYYSIKQLSVMSWFSDVVTATPSAVPPQIGLSRARLNFAYFYDSYHYPQEQTFNVFPLSGTINWSAQTDTSWIYLENYTGMDAGTVKVDVYPSSLSPGLHSGVISVTDSNASNSPQVVTVTVTVYENGETAGPFGDFSTPVDNAVVSGSIPVTGWALDDVRVKNVKIYREEGGNLVFIGDASFVEGARPDLEKAYPSYPYNYRAGWGYMMLTNFLPDNGNGTFRLHAVAEDQEGNQVTLGTRTIVCDNANAVNPFGALDTPGQGETVNGGDYVNWGWVLTPQPNRIPTDGSTIGVYVNGVFVGRPTYNNYRSDIATYFPGYANTNGAVGYFHLDTTAYDDGVYTIQWTAKDSGGNIDGIGSRFFTIKNSGYYRSTGEANGNATGSANERNADRSLYKKVSGNNSSRLVHVSQLARIPIKATETLKVRKGYDGAAVAADVNCTEPGEFMVHLEELQRLVVIFPEGTTVMDGYMVVGEDLRPLPIGSTINKENGTFYWQPGPAFVGDYQLVFVEKSRGGLVRTRNITARIIPKTFKKNQ